MSATARDGMATVAARSVLDLRDSPWVDGPGRTILDTAAMVDPHRYRITIGGFATAGAAEHKYLEEAVRRGLDTCRILERRALDPDVLRQILHRCRSRAVDLVHAHDFRSDLYGLLAARWLGLPCIATCHGWIANDRKGRLYTSIDKWLLRFFDRVIVVSERMRDQLSASGVAAHRIAVVQNALIVENYRPCRGRAPLREPWGVPASHRLVGTIGRLSPEKCQDVFLRAAAEVSRRVPDVSFAIVGIGPEEQRLRRLAAELGVATRVVFAGYHEDMHAVYDSLDVVVQSSRTEGMPNVVLEALLMRVPVVATDVGGTAEIVTDGKSGWLVPPDDDGALAHGMLEALADPARAEARADAGERHVRRGFSHAVRLQRILAAYDEALGDDGRPR